MPIRAPIVLLISAHIYRLKKPKTMLAIGGGIDMNRTHHHHHHHHPDALSLSLSHMSVYCVYVMMMTMTNDANVITIVRSVINYHPITIMHAILYIYFMRHLI
jgi:hypothetical protein